MSQWWVYMVRCQSGRLYTGISTDPQRRFNEHCGDSRRGARFFRSDPAQALVYVEPAQDRSGASSREAQIKKLPRQAKLALIMKNPTRAPAKAQTGPAPSAVVDK